MKNVIIKIQIMEKSTSQRFSFLNNSQWKKNELTIYRSEEN